MNALAFATLALVPMMAGPLPQSQSAPTLTAALCNGGSITIPLGERDDTPPRDCRQQGCHAGHCRKRIDQDRGLGGRK
jgi:hypothetical protein